MNSIKWTKNRIFRVCECQLTREQTAELCFKSATTVRKWDAGREIPPECKRLMRMARGREIHHSPDWEGFQIVGEKLKLPNDETIGPQQIVTGWVLLNNAGPNERPRTKRFLRIATHLAKIMVRNRIV
ncbi:regulator [Vibrio albus]|uniref:Regulator n=1 Tax=Vibrio albus TaxID=2200953 RepID=A0A2U3BBK4_9VIBR|nr:regulator [Vibrio albus]PWI34158.1 regulator [Vibrio albus]